MGHHKIGACAEIGQNRIRGGWGVKKTQKTSDIIYVRSLTQKSDVICECSLSLYIWQSELSIISFYAHVYVQNIQTFEFVDV